MRPPDHRRRSPDGIEQYAFLVDESIEPEGLVLFGTAWTTPLSRWQRRRDVLEGCFSRIPDNVDILVSHSPRYGCTTASRTESIPARRRGSRQSNGRG